MRFYGRALVILALAGLATLSLSEAYAREPRKRDQASNSKIAEIETKLASSDPKENLEGLSLVLAHRKEAPSLVPLVEKLLGRGANLEVTHAALRALGEIGGTTSSAALRPYVRHRLAELRLSAIEALTKTGGLEAVFTLRRALGDPELAVRRGAAKGLGLLGAKEAIDELFLSLDRGLEEAAFAIATICAPSHCEKLLTKLEGLSVEVVTKASSALLPRADLPDAEKLAAVALLRSLGPEANAHIRDLASRLKYASPGLRQALEEAIEATKEER